MGRELKAIGNPQWRFLLVTGFLGAYTTFSTFEYETLQLLGNGQMATALLYVGASVMLGLLAVWLGAGAGRWLV